jgi:hypothetical protein
VHDTRTAATRTTAKNFILKDIKMCSDLEEKKTYLGGGDFGSDFPIHPKGFYILNSNYSWSRSEMIGIFEPLIVLCYLTHVLFMCLIGLFCVWGLRILQ